MSLPSELKIVIAFALMYLVVPFLAYLYFGLVGMIVALVVIRTIDAA